MGKSEPPECQRGRAATERVAGVFRAHSQYTNRPLEPPSTSFHNWRFTKGDPADGKISLLYDVRPPVGRRGEGPVAGRASAATNPPAASPAVIKPWILPTGNDFIKATARRCVRPKGNLGERIAYVQPDDDDRAWRRIDLPQPYAYRLRWDEVVYEPGALKVIAYKNGKPWATDEMKTAGPPARLKLEPDRNEIRADGRDLSFITVNVTDEAGLMVPRASNRLHFAVEGPGEIVATDNGDPTSFEPFPSHDRLAFNGLCLVIVRGKPGLPGRITLTASSDGLKRGTASVKTDVASP